MSRPRRSGAGYLVGWLLFATAGRRALIFYGGKPALPMAIAFLAGYALLYAADDGGRREREGAGSGRGQRGEAVGIARRAGEVGVLGLGDGGGQAG